MFGKLVSLTKKGTKLHEIRKMASDRAIIFIHGLTGDPISTWRKKGENSGMPEAMASDPMFKDFDIYSFGYKSNCVGIHYKPYEIAKILRSEIAAKIKSKSIVIICHSMGGIVTQNYVLELIQHNDKDLGRITKVAYLAVPFEGSIYASLLGYFQSQAVSIGALTESIQKIKEGWWAGMPKTAFPQLLLYGRDDAIVSLASAQPSHMKGDHIEIRDVDEDHTSICKVNELSTVYALIRNFILCPDVKQMVDPMIVWIHGTDRQQHVEQPHLEIDWTKHVDIQSKPRKMPTDQVWNSQIIPEIEKIEQHWSKNKVNYGSKIRIYPKCLLSAAVLIGSRLSYTKGVQLEVEHYGEIWSSTPVDNNFKVHVKRSMGNQLTGKTAVVALSVAKDIEEGVMRYLNEDAAVSYRLFVNVVPDGGTGRDSIKGDAQANRYAIAVKDTIETLINEGIEEVHLFLSIPLGLAFLVGHQLTGICPTQTYEYANPGFVSSCRL